MLSTDSNMIPYVSACTLMHTSPIYKQSASLVGLARIGACTVESGYEVAGLCSR